MDALEGIMKISRRQFVEASALGLRRHVALWPVLG
jgi:hypothetical protein